MNKNYIKLLHQLDHNNNRPWFQEHKPLFDEMRAEWMADIDRLIAACSAWDPRLAMYSAKECVYRIYRDTRFSPDKTPYKTHLSASFSQYGRKVHCAGFYVQAGIEPDQTGLFAGMWCPDSTQLRKLRHAIVDNIEEFTEIITQPDFVREFPEWCGDTLKTIPKGWPKDHPDAELLRLLHYGREHMVAAEYFCEPDWPERCAATLATSRPLVDFINYSLFEE